MNDESTLDLERKLDKLLLGVITYAGRILRTTFTLWVKPWMVVEHEGERRYCRPVVYYLLVSILAQFALVSVSLTNSAVLQNETIRNVMSWEAQILRENSTSFSAFNFMLLLAPQIAAMACFSFFASSAGSNKITFSESFAICAYAVGCGAACQGLIWVVAFVLQQYGVGGDDLLFVFSQISFVPYLFLLPWIYLSHAKIRFCGYRPALLAGAKGSVACIVLLGLAFAVYLPALRSFEVSHSIADLGNVSVNQLVGEHDALHAAKRSSPKGEFTASDELTRDPENLEKLMRAGGEALDHDQVGLAENLFSRVIVLIEKQPDASRNESTSQMLLIKAHEGLGDSHQKGGHAKLALDEYSQEGQLLERLLTKQPGDATTQTASLSARSRIAYSLVRLARHQEAIGEYKRLIADGEGMSQRLCGDKTLQSILSGGYRGLVETYSTAADVERMDVYRRAFDVLGKCRAGELSREARDDIAMFHDATGDILKSRSDLKGALDHYNVAASINRDVIKEEPGIARWSGSLAWSETRIGDIELTLGNDESAMEHFREAARLSYSLTSVEPNEATWQMDLAWNEDRLGDVLMKNANFETALMHYRAGNVAWKRLAAIAPDQALWKDNVKASDQEVVRVSAMVARDH